MKQNLYSTMSKSLLQKLALVITLILAGGSSAWGDTSVVDGTQSGDAKIASGWTNGGGKKVPYSSTTCSAFLTSTEGCIAYNSSSAYSYYGIISDDKITIAEGQTIVINVKGINNYGSRCYLGYSADGSSWTTLTYTDVPRANLTDYGEIVISDVVGEYYLQFVGYQVFISSIKITGSSEIKTPILAVSPSSYNFGELTGNDSKEFTIENKGIGSFSATVTKSGTDADLFTITEGTLSGITSENAGGFTVSFDFSKVTSYGEKTATITVTPDYEGGEAKEIAITAYAKDPTIWEDFTDGIPSTWYNEEGSWLNYVSGFEGMASPGYMSDDVLRTPRLFAEEDETISFDVKLKAAGSSYKVTAKYSTDRTSWTTIDTYTESGTKTFTAPAAGYYWLQFTAYQSGIDNFVGWAIAPIAHESELGTVTIPATGIQYGDYTASVVLIEKGGSAETVNAELYFDGVKVAEQTDIAITGNTDTKISLTFTPDEVATGNVYIKITGENIGELETDPVEVTITEPTVVFDEDSEEHPTCTNTVVKVKYTPQEGWNTICLPFSLSGKPEYMKQIFGEDWKAYKISGYADNTLSFENTTYLSPSTPYLIYAPNAATIDYLNIHLKAVSVYGYNWTSSNFNQKKDNVTLRGNMTPKTFNAEEADSCYIINTKGEMEKAIEGNTLKAYRAYVTGLTEIATIVVDGVATNLDLIKAVVPKNNGIYNLQGQKVNVITKGLYIVDGKKVIVK